MAYMTLRSIYNTWGIREVDSHDTYQIEVITKKIIYMYKELIKLKIIENIHTIDISNVHYYLFLITLIYLYFMII